MDENDHLDHVRFPAHCRPRRPPAKRTAAGACLWAEPSIGRAETDDFVHRFRSCPGGWACPPGQFRFHPLARRLREGRVVRLTLIAPPLMDYEQGLLRPISMDAVRTCPPYGVYLLATVLRQEGHQVQVIDLVARGSYDLSPFCALLLSSDMVGIGASSLSWPTARLCIEQIRRLTTAVPIVLGGIHPTMFDEYVLATTSATFVIRGEAEIALPQLCRALAGQVSLKNVGSLSYRSPAGRFLRNPLAPKMSEQQLASFGPADFSDIPLGIYTGLAIESSRGCPCDCAFCSTSYRRSWRGIAAGDVASRIEQAMPFLPRTRRGLVQVIDDEFTVRTDRVLDICRELEERHLHPRLVYDARACDLLKPGVTERLAPYTHQLLVGAECGYDSGLERIGKGLTTKHLEDAAAELQRQGISNRADYSFILGLPWESTEDVFRTVRFAFHLHTTYDVRVLLQWYCQIPGSRLWDGQQRLQAVHEAQYDDFGFFRNLYLFRSGVPLPPSEVLHVHRTIESLCTLARRDAEGVLMVQASMPWPILQHYPARDPIEGYSGLASLRDVASAS